MGHDKLRKFAENETFSCILQPDTRALLACGYENLLDHPVKGHWSDFFAALGFKGDASSPLVLELGCGKGEYTVALGEKYPDKRFLGVDIKGARLWKGAKYATLNSVSNVAFLRSRIEFITAFFAPAEVSEIWLTFSDPQLSKENSRLTSPLFLERYRTFLAPSGIVHLKTDSRFLYEYTKAVCEANSLRIVTSSLDLYSGEYSGIKPAPEVCEVQTFYEDIFRSQGNKINYLAFCLDHDGPLVGPSHFDAQYWRSVEGPRQLFGRDTAETRRQKIHAESLREGGHPEK